MKGVKDKLNPLEFCDMSELDHYDYSLPDERIAQFPLANRSEARMLVIERKTGQFTHAQVKDLPQWLNKEDVVVVNDTKVVPARLVGSRTATGGAWEGLYLEANERGQWKLLSQTRGKLQPGERVTLNDLDGQPALQLEMVEKQPGGVWLAKPLTDEEGLTALNRVGRVPLPPYIRGGEMTSEDRARYQTVYAKTPGAVAAPTAGLHFTDELFGQLQVAGIDCVSVTLHVGLGTFRPVATETLAEHNMHGEHGVLLDEVAQRLHACRAQSGRIVAIGTTSVRVLETAAAGGSLAAWAGETKLFIRPPYEFRAVDALFTNFHLPRSTLLVLVRTFGGDELIAAAYQQAIQAGYRFYSYGDSMLIL